MDRYVQELAAFIAAHAVWTAPIMFVVSFGESFAFLSLLFPGTAIMLAAGALIPSGAVPVLPLLFGGITGAALGDGVSYWIGLRFGHLVPRLWPFSSRPELLEHGHAFFHRHGGKSVFIGRFFGPVRAVIPLVAGMMEMEPRRFWVANIASAILWAPLLLLPGLLATSVVNVTNGEGGWEWIALLGAVAVVAALALTLWLYRPKR
ncbi:MAG TPA: DedA family protein [Parvibaculum sp.]